MSIANAIIFVDRYMGNAILNFRSHNLIPIFFWITNLGAWEIIGVFTIIAVAILLIVKQRQYIIPLILTLAGSEILVTAGKLILRRERPNFAIYFENSFSFPSGHASLAFAFYGFIAYILIKNYKRKWHKIIIFLIALTLILLIGFSRLYLGVHYLSDVWGGFLVGAIWLALGISVCEYLNFYKDNKLPIEFNVHKYLFLILLIVAAGFAIYIAYSWYYIMLISEGS